MNLFENVDFPTEQIIGPLVVLIITMVIAASVYKILLGKILPPKVFDFFFGPVCLFGFYLWAIPMQMGFYDVFKNYFN
ncbi:hypothetical protein [Paenisporosarcina cavernae]|uniref:Uncharacterized protein n=1 Tax=Paenisporosarcina cavernae TaxID=2320858 RepID=A0A385YRS9_9BACL|nr:hypothetical protein [Paenisporosarcina cavernae]AYC28707.1 hypothetical protein D3873_02030 [Paenisporosarcina cavernae]